MNNIDKLTDKQVYNDPVSKIQNEMLAELLTIRQGFATAIDSALSSGGSGAGGATVAKEDHDKLEAENKKLRYRIKHLLRALDGGSSKPSMPAMKLHVAEGSTDSAVNVAAALCGASLEVIVVDEATRTSKAHAKINPTGRLPLLELEEGTISGVSTICKHLFRVSKRLSSMSQVEQARVDQWLGWCNTTLAPTCEAIESGIFGNAQIFQAHWNDASKEVKASIKMINTALNGKKWLVGENVSVADIMVASTLLTSFQTVLDGGFRKAMKDVTAWAERVFTLPEFVASFGTIRMCNKALKPVCEADPKKEAPKKESAKPAAKKEAPAEKPKDNVESLPPSPFDVYEFKTFYINHPDKKGVAIDETYKMLDWEGWSFWFLHYEKYKSEGKLLHVTNNLLGGFLSRAEHTTRYTFGRHCVLGDEPDLEIMGVWLMRGTELPDGLKKEHPQFEYYKSRKMDPRNNKDDDKLLREFFGGKEEDTINGLKA